MAANCPFYGRFLYRAPGGASTPFLLWDQQGNQCAIVTESYAPCRMETSGEPVEWRECPLMQDLRMEFDR